LENAVASMPEQGKIKISSTYNKELKFLTMSVYDSGCGIPQEDKTRLFEPYFSTKKTGTGLGLAIVSTIITDHNGYIRVRDNKPTGTIFIVELPATISVS
jgi:two-component system nitrogen regulation sensor histidine kinase NtrY